MQIEPNSTRRENTFAHLVEGFRAGAHVKVHETSENWIIGVHVNVHMLKGMSSYAFRSVWSFTDGESAWACVTQCASRFPSPALGRYRPISASEDDGTPAGVLLPVNSPECLKRLIERGVLLHLLQHNIFKNAPSLSPYYLML